MVGMAVSQLTQKRYFYYSWLVNKLQIFNRILDRLDIAREQYNGKLGQLNDFSNELHKRVLVLEDLNDPNKFTKSEMTAEGLLKYLPNL